MSVKKFKEKKDCNYTNKVPCYHMITHSDKTNVLKITHTV